MTQHHHIVIIGGGTGGLTVAAHLRDQDNPPEVTVIEPSAKHYYQPIWTLVGGGVFPREVSERNQKDFIPSGVRWLQDKVASFDPDQNQVLLASGQTISYDFLIVAAGIQIDWNKIPGLAENIGQPRHLQQLQLRYCRLHLGMHPKHFRGGNAVFTQPNTPIKCGGAPQKIMYLAEDHFRRTGIRDKSRTSCSFCLRTKCSRWPSTTRRSPAFVQDRNLDIRHKRQPHRAARPDKKEAVFEKLGGEGTETIDYEMIHVTPPMSSPDFIKQSGARQSRPVGWTSNKDTLQHNTLPQCVLARRLLVPANVEDRRRHPQASPRPCRTISLPCAAGKATSVHLRRLHLVSRWSPATAASCSPSSTTTVSRKRVSRSTKPRSATACTP